MVSVTEFEESTQDYDAEEAARIIAKHVKFPPSIVERAVRCSLRQRRGY